MFVGDGVVCGEDENSEYGCGRDFCISPCKCAGEWGIAGEVENCGEVGHGGEIILILLGPVFPRMRGRLRCD